MQSNNQQMFICCSFILKCFTNIAMCNKSAFKANRKFFKYLRYFITKTYMKVKSKRKIRQVRQKRKNDESK